MEAISVVKKNERGKGIVKNRGQSYFRQRSYGGLSENLACEQRPDGSRVVSIPVLGQQAQRLSPSKKRRGDPCV